MATCNIILIRKLSFFFISCECSNRQTGFSVHRNNHKETLYQVIDEAVTNLSVVCNKNSFYIHEEMCSFSSNIRNRNIVVVFTNKKYVFKGTKHIFLA